MFSFFFSFSVSLPHSLHFTPSQTRWSGFVWLLCPGSGSRTGGSSLSWRAPPGPQTVAGAACCAAARCCWHRDCWSIWCQEVCVLICAHRNVQVTSLVLPKRLKKIHMYNMYFHHFYFSNSYVVLLSFISLLQVCMYSVSLVSLFCYSSLCFCPFCFILIFSMSYLSCFISFVCFFLLLTAFVSDLLRAAFPFCSVYL